MAKESYVITSAGIFIFVVSACSIYASDDRAEPTAVQNRSG
jgi:hypothetical protein